MRDNTGPTRSLRMLPTRAARDGAGNACRGAKARGLVFSSGLGSERAYHKADLPHLDPDAPGGVSLATVDLWPAGKLTKRCELDEILDDIRNRLENLSEMGEMESLRLQMAMDRLSKMMSTLSNLLKKASDTAQAITQNLK